MGNYLLRLAVFPSLLSNAVMGTMANSDSGRRGYTRLTLPHHTPSLREVRTATQSRNPEAGAGAEAQDK